MILPQGEFDGQEFIDTFRIKWVFDASYKVWRRYGQVPEIPLASSTTTGLLSNEDKLLLDGIADKGGGFAILTKPLLSARTVDNPDGVLYGEIGIVSESLNFLCVDGQGNQIEDSCLKVCFKENDPAPPGFDVGISDDFFASFCVEVPGGQGPIGETGDQGKPGEDGTGDGPVGLAGDDGLNATTHHKLTGVKIIDVDNFFDSAVVRAEIDQANGTLLVTKGKIDTPNEDELIAERLVARQLLRTVKFVDDCWKYTIEAVPCGPEDDYNVLDPYVAYYPSHFEEGKEGDYQLVKRRLSNLVDQIIDFYQVKLDKASEDFDKQIWEFIQQKDKECRLQLDELSDRLVQCENITFLDYCVGINEDCPEGGKAGVNLELVGKSECAMYADLVCQPTEPVTEGIAAQITEPSCAASHFTIYPGTNAVFSFLPPDPFKYPSIVLSGTPTSRIAETPVWIMFNDDTSNAVSFVPKGGLIPANAIVYAIPTKIDCDGQVQVSTDSLIDQMTDPRPPTFKTGIFGGVSVTDLAAAFHTWAVDLATRLNAGKTYWPKTQLNFGGSIQFQPGWYIFDYTDGAAYYQGLNTEERFGEPFNSLLFRQWTNDERDVLASEPGYAGGQGATGSLSTSGISYGAPGGLHILNPFDLTDRVSVSNSQFCAIEGGGFELGVYNGNYDTLLPLAPESYFAKHAFDPNTNYGAQAANQPRNIVDHVVELPSTIATNEAKISWYAFPSPEVKRTNGTPILIFDSAKKVRQAYANTDLTRRAVIVYFSQATYVWARITCPFTAYNAFGNLIMPPNSVEDGVTYSNNRAMIYRTSWSGDFLIWPSIAIRPQASGAIKMKITKVTCPERTLIS